MFVKICGTTSEEDALLAVAMGADAEALAAAGYDAVLVGESLVTSDDPGAALRELRVPCS